MGLILSAKQAAGFILVGSLQINTKRDSDWFCCYACYHVKFQMDTIYNLAGCCFYVQGIGYDIVTTVRLYVVKVKSQDRRQGYLASLIAFTSANAPCNEIRL